MAKNQPSVREVQNKADAKRVSLRKENAMQGLKAGKEKRGKSK